MGNGASHWEATDQSRLVRSWEGATGKVGQCPSAVSRETQGPILWRDRGIGARSSGASARPVPSYHHLGKVSSID